MLCLSTPTGGLPHIYYTLGGNLGSLLHGDVSVIIIICVYVFDDHGLFVRHTSISVLNNE